MKQLKLSSKVGLLGEGIALKKLLTMDFEFVTKNYLEKTGEIDIIVRKDHIIHFIEVKSVSCENLHSLDNMLFKPADNVTEQKLQRMHRTIELYLEKKYISRETTWQIDVISVYINQNSKQAKVEILWNIVA
jgi:putative endonuclease